MRLYEVSPNLYVSGSPTERDIPKLREAGVSAIICLSRKRTPDVVAESVRSWYYHPVPDGRAVPNLNALTTLVVDLRRQGHVVLIHCLAGRNRSMLLAALVAMRLEHWTGQEALEHCRWLRPSCLHNEIFAEHLRSLP